MGSEPAPTAAQRYPWRVRCDGCGWVDTFATVIEAQARADNHQHRARVSRRDDTD